MCFLFADPPPFYSTVGDVISSNINDLMKEGDHVVQREKEIMGARLNYDDGCLHNVQHTHTRTPVHGITLSRHVYYRDH